LIDVHEDILTPQLVDDILTGYQLVLSLYEEDQQVEGLALELHAPAIQA